VEKLESAVYVNVEKGEWKEVSAVEIVELTPAIFLIREDRLEIASFGE
jgi:hypothetical protein